MIVKELEKMVRKALSDDAEIVFEHPENMEYGDYSTNVALVLAKQLGKNPREVAESIVSNFDIRALDFLEKVEVAGPGFLNFFLTKKYFIREAKEIAGKKEKYGRGEGKKKVMVEFTDPNPFKEFHIGHLYSNAAGESISRLLELQGAEVKRVNYQGDVGLHVAKAIWGMQQSSHQMPEEKASLSKKAQFLGACYAYGNSVYEPVDKILLVGSPKDSRDSWQKQEESDDTKRINEINTAVYDKSDKEVNRLYEQGKKWSLDYFKQMYERLGTKFDTYYFESDSAKIGKKIVEEGVKKGIFEKSQGAIIFPGEKYGLHSRVFINSKGLPTYEAKELGLAPTKYKDFQYDLSLIITGNEIIDYFKVLLAALKEIDPMLSEKTKHLSHGMVRLPEGKMSSRSGNIVTGEELIDEVKRRVRDIMKSSESEVAKEEQESAAETIAIGAIKYSLLRVSLGKDIIFDFEKSLSLQGESGPYLQYTYVRCKSILRETEPLTKLSLVSFAKLSLVKEEVVLLRLLYRFPEVARDSAKNFTPHMVAGFVFDVAQAYNNFYAKHRVLKADTKEQKDFRLLLTSATAQIIQNSLHLLGIKTLEQM
ncbi:MAG: arginine--tRNA ligase [bacterium]|nr:arginine--tRNA ligase [bacterium]